MMSKKKPTIKDVEKHCNKNGYYVGEYWFPNKPKKMSKTDYFPLIPICSDKELKEIAEQWCHLVGAEPTTSTLNAFCMGAKIAISNKGWLHQDKEDNINDCGDANEY